MDTIHPERWTDDWYLWSKQLIWQNMKNVVKRVIIKDQSSPREIEVAGFLNKIIFKISRGKKIKVLK